jgi:phosphatidylglycerol:prolipoprotein diacylglycerol transferase
MGYESISGKAWPTPFYESAISIAMFLILWLFRKRITAPGLMFSIYLLLTGTERFFIEKIRINPPYHFFGMEATQAEIISVLLIIIGIVSILFTSRRKAI